MTRLRLRSAATVQRASPNPAGDGAGNFQDGWDDFVGPIACQIIPRQSGGENMREGQIASAQGFFVDLRATVKTRAIDVRDRVQEIGGQGRLLGVVANMFQPGQSTVRLLCEQTPVKSPQPADWVEGGETESPPTFPVGP
jgi:hypothetical protein